MALKNIFGVFIAVILLSGCGAHMHVAAYDGDIVQLRAFVEGGDDVNAKFMGMPPIIYAIMGNTPNSYKVVRFLLAQRADPNFTFKNSMGSLSTPLGLAIRQKNLDMIKVLVDGGADLNKTFERSGFSMNYLISAVVINEPKIVQFFLDHDADPNFQIAGGFSPLSFSIDWMNPPEDIKTKLKDNNIEIDIFKSREIIALLLAYGADVNTVFTGGTSPLQMVIKNGDIETTKMLIHAGANVNSRDENGETPLLAAKRSQNSRELVTLLKENGAQ